jgi:hypothetical protein
MQTNPLSAVLWKEEFVVAAIRKREGKENYRHDGAKDATEAEPRGKRDAEGHE